MTWADVAVAGAFVLGVIGGAVASIRIFKHVVTYLRSDRGE